MKVLTSREMASVDRQATEQFSVPSLTLMENAGRSVAEAAAAMAGGIEGRKIAVFCGKGNNGGDGLVASRHLLAMGARPVVFLLSSFQDLKGDARANLDAATRAGVKVSALSGTVDDSALRKEVHGSVLLIDAILGTGFAPPVRGVYGRIINFIGGTDLPLLAVDLPSGLSSDTGRVSSPSLTADCTVTFGLPKPAHFLHPAAARCGRLYLADIGFPAALLEKTKPSYYLTTPRDASAMLHPRLPDSHKGTFGHVLLLAGSKGYAGAAHLAARGALRGGAGLVTVALPESQAPPLFDSLPEAMLLPLADTGRGTAGARALDILLENLHDKSVLAAGPGISRDPETSALLRHLLPEVTLPAVLDADGLNAIVGNLSVLLKSRSEIVVTPHPGELGRLLNLNTSEILERRAEVSVDFAKKYGVIVVLKGANTLVATPAGNVHFNVTGNAGMASGGTGDVLTGVIASLIAQGASPLESALLGVYLHGKAGDLAAATVGPRGFLASEVADLVPRSVAETMAAPNDEHSSHGKLRLLVP